LQDISKIKIAWHVSNSCIIRKGYLFPDQTKFLPVFSAFLERVSFWIEPPNINGRTIQGEICGKCIKLKDFFKTADILVRTSFLILHFAEGQTFRKVGAQSFRSKSVSGGQDSGVAKLRK
jgi:hypothetical protein